MSAVLVDAPVMTRTVPLTSAVEFNPKPVRGALADDFEISFVPMAAVEAGSGRMDPTQARPYADVKKGFTYFCDGDVLFAKITPCMENGKMAVAHGLRNGIGYGSTEFHVLRPREGVDAQYVYHFVSGAGFRREAAHHMTGAVGQKRVPLSFLQQSNLPLPPIIEQRRIVSEIEKQFSRLDEAVGNLRRVKANLKRYVKSVLQEAVAGRLVEAEGERRKAWTAAFESASELLASIVEERDAHRAAKGKRHDAATAKPAKLFALPAGWAWASVEQVGRLQLGRQRAPKYHQGPNMRPYLRVQNVFEDCIDLDDVMHMNFSPEDYERFVLKASDVLLNEGQSPELLGRPAIYRGEMPGACFTNTLIRFQAYRCALPEFALIVFRHYMHAGRFVDEGTITTNIAHLSLGRLAAVEFPLPPLVEQHRIVAEVDRRLSIVREVEAEVDANLKRAQALRQAVLTKAFGRSATQTATAAN